MSENEETVLVPNVKVAMKEYGFLHLTICILMERLGVTEIDLPVEDFQRLGDGTAHLVATGLPGVLSLQVEKKE